MSCLFQVSDIPNQHSQMDHQKPTIKTYIWSYEATTVRGLGKVKGRVEAPNGYEAQIVVKQSNLMINSISVKLLKNQDQARKEKFIKYTGIQS
ncbi:hypothetical protein [Acinetobacter sp. A47]|uniref:hypothetical protein n=1 Tax=Acinetobacter sp. A47 TaxID=1561217 RepID=UPI001D0D450B|nr:hypothetical protein [Acinetobacter sp. A47]